MSVALATPKFRSQEFRLLKAQLWTALGQQGLKQVFHHALERRGAELALAKIKKAKPGQLQRGKELSREALAERLSEVFETEDEAAFACVRDLDKVCSKERHTVAQTEDGEIADRMRSYPALALPRERARMVWALARDTRQEAHSAARSVLERTDAAMVPAEPGVAQIYKEQATQLTEAALRLTSLESSLQKAEEERARLMAQVGSKERALKEERQARAEDASVISELRAELRWHQSQRQQTERALACEAELRSQLEELEQKLRRSIKLAEASKGLVEAQDELEQAKRQVEEGRRIQAKLLEELETVKDHHSLEQERFRSEQSELRDELKLARRRIVDLEKLVPQTEASTAEKGTVGILLDQANLAATAYMGLGRKVNFSALLHHLTVGRKCSKAVAFVVDNGGTHFDAFCTTLRQSGWDLRVKKPKLFTDGTSKADWDMGLAVEAVLLRGQVETVVLGSGDGDFAPLIKLLKRWGLRVEVASFPEGLAIDLQNAADGVTVLGAESLE